MTTIVWDGKTLAVDSQTSYDDRMSRMHVRKLFLNVGNYAAVAVCGESAAWPAMVDWVHRGCDALDWKDWRGAIWCVKDDGTCHRHASGYPEVILAAEADGSGEAFAVGAMEMGADAVQALRVAMKWDLYSGGDVQSYTITGEGS